MSLLGFKGIEEYRAMVKEAAQYYLEVANEEQRQKIDYDLVHTVAQTDFTLVQAAQIIAEFGRNVEEDEGLWCSSVEPEDQLKDKAYWSFNNDVVEELRLTHR